MGAFGGGDDGAATSEREEKSRENWKRDFDFRKRDEEWRGTYKGIGVYALLGDGRRLVLDDFPIEVLQSLHDSGLVVVPAQCPRINEFLV